MIVKNSKSSSALCRRSNIPTPAILSSPSAVARMSESRRLSIASSAAKILRAPAHSRGRPARSTTTRSKPTARRSISSICLGYGFAKASQKEREKWGQFIENYLLKRDACQLVLQVIDLRHPPTKDDIAMYQWLRYYDKPVQVVATKADKIARGQYENAESPDP